MSWTDRFCKSLELSKKEQSLCYQLASDFCDIITDLEKKGYLRSELKVKTGEKERVNSEYVIENLRKVTDGFNKFSLMYKENRKKIVELGKSYGLTAENLRYVYFSEMIFIFLQNIEAFRFALLFIMKLDKDKYLKKDTTLGTLLWRLKELRINKSDTLTDVDYALRNALSHGLFWLDVKGDSTYREPYLKYATDLTFKKINAIRIADLHSKMRKQAIYTLCLLYRILDWFSGT